MLDSYPLKTRQVCLFFIAFLPVIKFFMMPSLIAKSAAQDMWISTLINIAIDFFTLFILVAFNKKYNLTFRKLTEDLLGKTGAKIICILYCFYFLLKSLLIINQQKDYVELTFYIITPSVLHFLPFFFTALLLCMKKLRVIGRLSDIMWFITAVSYLLLIALSISNVDITALLPIGVNGIDGIIKGSFQSLNWFGDSVYFIFFMGNFIHKEKDGIKISLSFIISSLSVLVFIIIFYGVFSSIAFRQRFALTETSKYTTVINNLERFDYVGIFGILASNIIASALPLFFACRLIYEIFPNKNKWIYPITVCVIAFVVIYLFSQYFSSIEDFMLNLASGFYLLMGNVLPLLLVVCYTVKHRKEKYYALYQS